jgi:hypothetical protein
MTLLE